MPVSCVKRYGFHFCISSTDSTIRDDFELPGPVAFVLELKRLLRPSETLKIVKMYQEIFSAMGNTFGFHRRKSTLFLADRG